MFSSKLVLVYSLFFLVLPLGSIAHILKACKFEAIYQLGDSLSDTGNVIIENPSSAYARLPYGQNFYKKATALSAGLPLLDAYLNPKASTSHGVNFAVAGSTALPVEFLAEKYSLVPPVTNSSLTVQLGWMLSHFNTTCYSRQDCSKKLEKSLFLVGEIGGNDYIYSLLEGKTIDEVKSVRSDVVKAIKDAILRVIDYGATRIVVPGNLPMGCLPAFLTEFDTNDSNAYDEFHCLKEVNSLSMNFNGHLQKAIEKIEKEHPNVTIIYGDFYNAYKWILQNAQLLGFSPNSLQKACCGSGGNYNYNVLRRCGASGVPVCPNPQQHISWDGIHLTQEAYRHLATWIICDIFQKLQCGV
ncbi:GDSL esterase/lipase At5g03980 isoform X2 [Manihot esculenta]|uniref:Uncharacterized protein n=1 Tax=Manihot esculenta TaxID=3983 RepID=A0ACB7GUW1_MANES|nr:GDSL esterase/lipase At5g03980 isoform X2 [Manihot esculenta]KAG8644162.1 hypothetical protein MANES_11G105200v8 [Manihot esculenta]